MSEETNDETVSDEAQPTPPTMDTTMQARLLEAFPKSAIGHKPQRNNKAGTTVQIEFVGHAAVTKRLLEVDPYWTWRPLVVDEYGRPQFEVDRQGSKIGFWIELTVGGVSRFGYGSVASGAFEAEKQLIGDALRNAAMRFGVAVDLWHRGELASTLSEADEPAPRTPMVQKQPQPSRPPAQVVKDHVGVTDGPARPAAPSGPPPQPQLGDDSTSDAVEKLLNGQMVAFDTLEAIDGVAQSQPLDKMPTKLLVTLVLARHEVMEGLGRWKPGSLDRNIGKFASKHGFDLSPDLEQWDSDALTQFAAGVLGIGNQ